MLDLQRYVDGDALFDGQYKLRHRLSEVENEIIAVFYTI